MKQSLAVILATSVGLAGCGLKDDTPQAAVIEIQSKGQPVAAEADTLKKVAPAFKLSGVSANASYDPKVYFYNDPEDSTRRCQAVVNIESTNSTCWKLEPQ